MTLQREQIDVLLDDLETTARRRHRENPGDPGLSRDIVAQTRALLRTVELEHHLHICDTTQHLLLTLSMPAAAEPPALMHATRTGGPVADLGIPLVADPFDLDAYLEDEADRHATAAAVPGEGACVEGGDTAVTRPNRRQRDGAHASSELRRGLTAQQLATLDTMAHFGWKLEFVRRPMFQPPMPVAFDRNRDRFVVVAGDGTAEEDPSVRVRS